MRRRGSRWHGAHTDPVGRSELARREVVEEEALDDHYDYPHVEHHAKEPDQKAPEHDLACDLEEGRDLRTEDRDARCTDGP